MGERLVGVRIIHSVIFLLVTVEHGVVDEIATLLAVGPPIAAVPEYLGSPHTAHAGIALVDIGAGRVAENAGSLSEIKGHRRPCYEVLALQQVDAIIVPPVRTAHTHVGCHHQIAFSVMFSANICVSRTTFYTREKGGTEYRITAQYVLIMQSVAAHGIGRPLTFVAHVAIEIAIRAFLKVLRKTTE